MAAHSSTTQLAVRVSPEVAADLESLIAEYQRNAPPGVKVSRSDVLRESVIRGIAVLREELGATSKRGRRA